MAEAKNGVQAHEGKNQKTFHACVWPAPLKSCPPSHLGMLVHRLQPSPNPSLTRVTSGSHEIKRNQITVKYQFLCYCAGLSYKKGRMMD